LPKTKSSRADTKNVARSLAHPTRIEILTVLHEGPASAKELARALGKPLNVVTHHIHELRGAEAIEVAFTRKVKNLDQNFWRAIRMPTYYPEDLERLSREEHQVVSRMIVQSIMAEMLGSLSAGLLAGDAYAVTGWDRVWLDEEGYKAMYENTCAFFDRMYEIGSEAVVRAAASGEELKPYIGAVASFQRSRNEATSAVTLGSLGRDVPTEQLDRFDKLV
jgi:DNA-binding transcriptional ArsR family regulator